MTWRRRRLQPRQRPRTQSPASSWPSERRGLHCGMQPMHMHRSESMLTPCHLPLNPCRRAQQLLKEMESRGIQPAPTTAAAVGMHAAAAAQDLQLPRLPVVPEQPAHAVPESLGVDDAQKQPQGEPAASSTSTAAAASPPAAEEEEGPVAGGAPESAEAVLAQQGPQLAAQEARERGNACFRKHQFDKVRRHRLPRLGFGALWPPHLSLLLCPACLCTALTMLRACPCCPAAGPAPLHSRLRGRPQLHHLAVQPGGGPAQAGPL